MMERNEKHDFLKLLHRRYGEKRGWKKAAYNDLGIARPTFERYLKRDELGQGGQIPSWVWDKLKETQASEIDATPYDMVNLFALGLCLLQKDLNKFGHIQSPYPKPLQKAFHLAAAFNLQNKSQFPTNLADLIKVAHASIYTWCDEYQASKDGDSFFVSQLLDAGATTADCENIGALATAAGDVEKEYYDLLMEVCEDIGGDEGEEFYIAWRRVVIEKPVVDSAAVFFKTDFEIFKDHPIKLGDLIDKFYEEIPTWYAEDGKIPLCPYSKSRLKKTSFGYVTEFRDPIAQKKLKKSGPIWVKHTKSILELRRPLRLFLGLSRIP